MSRVAAVVAVLHASVLVSCVGSREAEVPPDRRFGHRYDDRGPEGRRTLEVTPPQSDVEYFYYPIFVDSIQVRPAPFEPGLVENGRVPVEVLVKGSLPDACSSLHEARQQRAGNIISVRLEMRRPQGAVCARVLRPFRFYLTLEGTYGAGSYTLLLNRQPYTFAVRDPRAG